MDNFWTVSKSFRQVRIKSSKSTKSDFPHLGQFRTDLVGLDSFGQFLDSFRQFRTILKRCGEFQTDFGQFSDSSREFWTITGRIRQVSESFG